MRSIEEIRLSDVTLLYMYLRIFLLKLVTALSSSSCRFSCRDFEYSIAWLTQFKVSKIVTRLTLDSIFPAFMKNGLDWKSTESTRGFVHDLAPWRSYFIVMASSRTGCLSRLRSIRAMSSRIIQIDRHFFSLGDSQETSVMTHHISLPLVVLLFFYFILCMCVKFSN